MVIGNVWLIIGGIWKDPHIYRMFRTELAAKNYLNTIDRAEIEKYNLRIKEGKIDI